MITNQLTLKEINERIKQVSNQQAALQANSENYTSKQIADLNETYQAQSQKYRGMQTAAIAVQEVIEPIIVSDKP